MSVPEAELEEAVRELASRRLKPYEPQAEAALRIPTAKP